MHELNPALKALAGAVETVIAKDVGWPCSIAKEQGPDGLVVELRDGSRWAVHSYQLADGK